MDQSAIGKLGSKVDETKVSPAKDGARAPQGQVSGGKAAGDTVQLTSGAQLLARMEQSLASAPAIDSARVAEVKAAIAEGNYDIDSGAIADAMIRFERSLGE